MNGSFSLARDVVGYEAGPELVAGIENLPLGEVDALAEAILAQPRTNQLTPHPVSQVWPLISMRASLFFDALGGSPVLGYGGAGVRLSAATDVRLRGSGAFSDGVVRALLYCHGLAIEDPLAHAAELHLSAPTEVRHLSRDGLAAAVQSLSEIAELLDSGIVETFYTAGDELPAAGRLSAAMSAALAEEGVVEAELWESFESEFIAALSAPLQQLWAQVRSGNRTPDLSLVRAAAAQDQGAMMETFVDVVRTLNPRSIIENAITSTACTISTIEMLGGSTDVLSASSLMGKLLFLGAPDPSAQLRVQELARTNVPNIGALSIGDLVAIRTGSEVLARWRQDLASALSYASGAREQGHSSDTVRVGVSEIMADARQALQAEAARTRVWSGANKVSFVAGALGGAGGAAVGGSVGSVVLGAVTGGAAAALQALGAKKRVPSYLDRHYVAFTDAKHVD